MVVLASADGIIPKKQSWFLIIVRTSENDSHQRFKHSATVLKFHENFYSVVAGWSRLAP